MFRSSRRFRLSAVLAAVAVLAAIAGVSGRDGGHDFQATDAKPDFNGTSKPESINGNDKANTLNGQGGADRIYGQKGNDALWGGDGADEIHGHDGNDTINGGAAADDLYGNEGNDTIDGGDGWDSIDTGPGNDTVHGNEGSDRITVRGNGRSFGDAGDDYLYLAGALGGVEAFGGDGNDTFLANERPSDAPSLTVACGSGADVAYVLKQDVVAADCEQVFRGTRPTVTATAAATVYTPNVPISLSISDKENDVTQMRVWQVEEGAVAPGWSPYASSTNLTLKGAFGQKVIIVNVKDAGGNEAGTFFAVDWKDGHPPKITALGGASVVPTSPATVSVTATDPDNDITQIRTGVFGYSEWSAWKTYSSSVSIPLSGTKGGRALLVQVRDSKGNESAAEVKFITYGTVADGPGTAPKITSVTGPGTVSSPKVDLTIAATDPDDDLKEIRTGVFGHSEWSSWKPFAANVRVALPGGFGNKAVLVQVRDAKGNESAVDVEYVTYRRSTAPTLHSVSAPAAVNEAKVDIAINATDPDDDIDEMRTLIAKDNKPVGNWTSWKPYAAATTVALPASAGTYVVLVQVRDDSGQVSGVAGDDVAYRASGSGGGTGSGSGDTGGSAGAETPPTQKPRIRARILTKKATYRTCASVQAQNAKFRVVDHGTTWYCKRKVAVRSKAVVKRGAITFRKCSTRAAHGLRYSVRVKGTLWHCKQRQTGKG